MRVRAMKELERLELMLNEYRSIVSDSQVAQHGKQVVDVDTLQSLLVQRGDWTEEGAEELLLLARRYGSFMLGNAFALAESMGIADGELSY